MGNIGNISGGGRINRHDDLLRHIIHNNNEDEE
jgi:hypothetical protein